MTYTSIADIYAANGTIRERLLNVLNGIGNDEASAIPPDEKWSIRHIVEHIWMVEFGTARICSRLLEAAKTDGRPSDGRFSLGPQFGERAAHIAVTRVEAPERVQPTGDVTIDEAVKRMAGTTATLESLRDDLEKFDLTAHTFPHPFFGELNAGEWLVLAGLHEQRHTKQIEKLLGKVRE